MIQSWNRQISMLFSSISWRAFIPHYMARAKVSADKITTAIPQERRAVLMQAWLCSKRVSVYTESLQLLMKVVVVVSISPTRIQIIIKSLGCFLMKRSLLLDVRSYSFKRTESNSQCILKRELSMVATTDRTHHPRNMTLTKLHTRARPPLRGNRWLTWIEVLKIME